MSETPVAVILILPAFLTTKVSVLMGCTDKTEQIGDDPH
jgi:hypothetical protein